MNKTKSYTLNNYIEEYNNGRDVSDICKEIGISTARFYTIVGSKTNKKDRTMWTKEDINYLKDNYNKLHITDLMTNLDRPEISIRVKAKELGIKSTNRIDKKTEIMKQISDEKYYEKYKNVINKYLKIYKDFHNRSELCDTLNITIAILEKLINRFNLPKPNYYGFTIDEYLEVYKNFKSVKDIADFFNVHSIKMNQFVYKHNLPKVGIISNHNKKWSTYEKNKLKRLYKKHTIKECANILGRSFESVKSKIKDLKISKNINKWSIHETDALKRLYKKHTVKECANILGRTFDSVKSKIKDLKIKK